MLFPLLVDNLLVGPEVVDRGEGLGANVTGPLLCAAVLNDGLHSHRDL